MSEQTYEELILTLTNEAMQRQLTDLEAGILNASHCQSQVADLVKALKKYGEHKIDCATNAATVADEFAAMGCTCGLEDIINKAQPSSTSVIEIKKSSEK